MRNIEINSDKTTVLVTVCFLVVLLVTSLSNLYGLLVHRPAALWRLDFDLVSSALILTYAAVMFCRASKIRKAYPYGVAGLCFMASSYLMRIAVQWANASVEVQNLFRPLIMAIDIVSSALILGEGVRWFRVNVKRAEGVKLAEDAKLAEDLRFAEKKTGREPHV